MNNIERDQAVNQLLSQITKFLSEYNQSNTWPDITKEEMDEARRLIRSLLVLKWGKASDGDSCVYSTIINRKKELFPLIDPLLKISVTDECYQNNIHLYERDLFENLRIANYTINLYQNQINEFQQKLNDLSSKRYCLEHAFEVWVVYYKPLNSTRDDYENYNPVPFSIHLSEEKANEFVKTVTGEHKILKNYAIPSTASKVEEYRQSIEDLCDIVHSSKSKNILFFTLHEKAEIYLYQRT